MKDILKCCVCGRTLPNRFAVAGECSDPDCKNVFCSLHWNQGNEHCPKHGWQDKVPETETVEKIIKEADMVTPENVDLPEDKKQEKQKAESAFKKSLGLLKKLGGGAIDLLSRLKKDNSPQAMLNSIEEKLNQNKECKAPLSESLQQIYNKIIRKKEMFQKAPRAMKSILEAELQALMTEYKSVEREYKVILENERVLNQVKGRLKEAAAYGMAGVNEDQIDDVALDLEDMVDDAEGRLDALRDLEKAGRRRERESDKEDFYEALAAFDVEEEGGLGNMLDDFEGEFTAPELKKDDEAEPEL